MAVVSHVLAPSISRKQRRRQALRSRHVGGALRRGSTRVAMRGVDLPVQTWMAEASLHQTLSQDIEERFGAVPQQPPEAINATVQRIESVARQCVAPSACAHPFGSTVNGFGETSSDLDVLIAIENEELLYYMSYVSWHTMEGGHKKGKRRQESGRAPESPQLVQVSERAAMAHAVNQLADFLPEMGFRVVRALPFARRPLVTIEDHAGELGECDVSVNNRLPLSNSELLRSYSLVNKRLRPMVLLVKTWAKNHHVCGANEGNLSSYAWTIMVVYFMQLVDGVPSLQQLAKDSRAVVDCDYWGYPRQFDTSFLSAEEYLHSNGGQAGQDAPLSLAELLYGFFRFFSREYHWGGEVVSIRKPERWEPDMWFRLYGKNHPEPGIHVEDPIELRDLNIVLRRDRLAQLKAELAGAADMLEGGSSLEEMLTSPALPSQPLFTPLKQHLRKQQLRKRFHKKHRRV